MVEANSEGQEGDAQLLDFLVGDDPSREHFERHVESLRAREQGRYFADTSRLNDSEKRLLAQLLHPSNTHKEADDIQDSLQQFRQDEEELQPEIAEVIEVLPARDRLISKALHVFTDERRIALLALLGINGDRTDGGELFERFRHLSGGARVHQFHLDQWLIGNQLAEVTGTERSGVRSLCLTSEGKALLPFAGHLLNWSVTGEESVRDVLGFSTVAVPASEEELELSTRRNYEQLKVLHEKSSEKIKIEDVMSVPGSADSKLRRILAHLEQLHWIEVLPGRKQPEESYPSFIPRRPFKAANRSPVTPRRALEDYIARNQEEGEGPMTLHGLFYKRNYMTASMRAGGVDNFVRDVVMEFAAMCSVGELERVRPAKLPNFGFVLNPAKANRLRDLVDLVEGARRSSDSYEKEGLSRLATWILSGDERLANRLQANS